MRRWSRSTSHEGVEERWQRTWEDEGLYNAEADDPREPYVICLPPPNVTDRLHMGHALNASAQDVLIRWHRMRDFNALWQPGYDHAGIALQAVMTRRLADEGKTRHDVGRDRFVELCWDFIRDYGGQIMGQLRSIGASLDYRRHRFTMDDDYARAVMRFFVHLADKGYVYRGTRIVNWCPGCASTVSDLEVNHLDVDDTLTYDSLPARRWRGPRDDRDGPAADDARRRGRGSPPRRRALQGCSWARRRSCRSPSAACRLSPTSAWILSSEPAPSRSRRGTIRWTGRSAATTGSPSRW